ncbi:hypothetical protein TrRE_jg3289 [Triparma retinervis]|uniref:PH domain-containing protein n=1 Tax=Triparma retinervis TaxID=2557542 RepID=A0A9W6ZFZ6_9STRA|nr:hypothetical protein TrRE_jg3289 [Triparma retinervis]
MNFGSSMFKGKMKEMKSKFMDKEMYMYLVDEFTNEPVYDDSELYPKVIETKSDLVDQHMPMMRVGLQAMAVMNGAAGLASCFCPGVPSRLVPKGLMEKATKFEAIARKDEEMEKKDEVVAKKDREILEKEAQIANLLDQLGLASKGNSKGNKKKPRAISRVAPEPPGDVQKLRTEMEEVRRESEELRRKLRAADSRALATSMSNLSSSPMASGSFSGSFSQEERGLLAATAVFKKGELLKKSKYRGKWQLRSITLTSDGKFSWIGGGSRHSGHVYLTVNSLASIEEPKGELWPFTLITEERKMLYASKTMEERDEWCEAITKFCSS